MVSSQLGAAGRRVFEEGTPYLPRAPTGQGSALDPFGLTKARLLRGAGLQVFWRCAGWAAAAAHGQAQPRGSRKIWRRRRPLAPLPALDVSAGVDSITAMGAGHSLKRRRAKTLLKRAAPTPNHDAPARALDRSPRSVGGRCSSRAPGWDGPAWRTEGDRSSTAGTTSVRSSAPPRRPARPLGIRRRLNAGHRPSAQTTPRRRDNRAPPRLTERRRDAVAGDVTNVGEALPGATHGPFPQTRPRVPRRHAQAPAHRSP